MSKLGRALRTKRLERDVTQAQVAKALQTQQSMIAMVEEGSADPGDELTSRIKRWISSGTVPGKAKRGAYQK